jgi:hypothetical protein
MRARLPNICVLLVRLSHHRRAARHWARLGLARSIDDRRQSCLGKVDKFFLNTAKMREIPRNFGGVRAFAAGGGGY